MNDTENPYGNIFISHRAIATIAYQAALESYGVVGLAPKNSAQGIAQTIVKDPLMGVEVRQEDTAISIDLYIVVEYGTRIKSVSSSVASSIRYKIEHTTGLTVKEVNVHVRNLRVSDTD